MEIVSIPIIETISVEAKPIVHKAPKIIIEKIDSVGPDENITVVEKPDRSEMQRHLEILKDKSKDIFEGLGSPDVSFN